LVAGVIQIDRQMDLELKKNGGSAGRETTMLVAS
jgi:hypothetical protein